MFGGPPAPDPGPAPSRVRLAAIVVLVGAGIGAVTNIAVAPLLRDYLVASLTASFRQQGLSTPPFDVGGFATAITAVTVVLGVAGCGLWVWLGLKFRAGRTWARAILTALFVLGLVSQPLSWIQGAMGHTIGNPDQPAPSLSLSLFFLPAVALVVVALVLMWSRQSRDWFTARDRYDRTRPR